MQMKQPGTGTSPIVVQSLRRVSGVQTIKRKVFTGDVPVGRTDLGPLHDKWTDVDLRMKIGNGTPGTVRWILKSGGATGSTRPGRASTSSSSAVSAPEWGIHRSLGDTSGRSRTAPCCSPACGPTSSSERSFFVICPPPDGS
jgi:chitin-binding protein